MRRRLFPLMAALVVAISAAVPSSSTFAQDEPKSNQFWWPERLDLSALRDHDPSSNWRSPRGWRASTKVGIVRRAS
jgi:catalase-peroxidase